eukprot:SAG31_NODE_8908_length_1365_cov_1.220379_1_plen_250_part_01
MGSRSGSEDRATLQAHLCADAVQLGPLLAPSRSSALTVATELSLPLAAGSDKPVRVAIIGSGLAGLTAGWLLSEKGNHVTAHIYEAAPSLGMGTHAVNINSGRGTSVSVDIPPRFVVPPYYTELSHLYRTIGIPFYTSNGAGCFQVVGKNNTPYFKFGTLRICGLSFPYVLAAPWRLVPYRIVWDLMRFRCWGDRHLRSGLLEGKSFGEYLDENYSKEFAELFAVPMLCVCVHGLAHPSLPLYVHLDMEW